MDGKIFISDPCSYCKMYLSCPKEQIYKSGPDSSWNPCFKDVLQRGFFQPLMIYHFKYTFSSGMLIFVCWYFYKQALTANKVNTCYHCCSTSDQFISKELLELTLFLQLGSCYQKPLIKSFLKGSSLKSLKSQNY